MKLVGSLRGKRAAETLAYLDGKHILSGHDVVQNYRSQAGFAAVAAPPKLLTFARKAPIAKINATMVKNQGQFVDPNMFRYTRPQGVSLWISPDGKLIRIPFHVRNADRVIKQMRLKNPVKYTGPEHEAIQTILNHGYVRVQMHDQSFAVDSSLPMSSGQVRVLHELSRGSQGKRSFAGRLVEPNGEHRAMIDDFSLGGRSALNKYIVESRGE
jgi:hypothetical protein